MCGRFTFQATAEDLAEYFAVTVSAPVEWSYNLAPTQGVPVVRLDRSDKRALSWIRWGLVPFWAKDKKIGSRTINARAEGIAAKPTFREPFRRRRCLVLASGFYEWQRQAAGKVPHYVTQADGHPLAFAGLWDRWRDPTGAKLDSCTIITTAANEIVAPIHDRMPVMLESEAQNLWLNRDATVDGLTVLLSDNVGPALATWAVSTQVNDPANNGPELLEPVD